MVMLALRDPFVECVSPPPPEDEPLPPHPEDVIMKAVIITTIGINICLISKISPLGIDLLAAMQHTWHRLRIARHLS